MCNVIPSYGWPAPTPDVTTDQRFALFCRLAFATGAYGFKASIGAVTCWMIGAGILTFKINGFNGSSLGLDSPCLPLFT